MSALTGIALVYQLVQDDVRRPDLQDKIWRNIHRAALAWHRADDWKRDLKEQEYVFDQEGTQVPEQLQNITGADSLFMNWAGQLQSTVNVQVIDLADLPRFRKFTYVKKWMTVTPYGTAIMDPVTGRQGTMQGGELLERNPDSMFDGYGYDATDKYYRSGEQVNVCASTPLSKVYIGWFQDPKLNLGCTTQEEFEDYESWIIDNYPDLIATSVKAKIFTDTGKVEEANALRRSGTGELYLQEIRLRSAETRVSTR